VHPCLDRFGVWEGRGGCQYLLGKKLWRMRRDKLAHCLLPHRAGPMASEAGAVATGPNRMRWLGMNLGPLLFELGDSFHAVPGLWLWRKPLPRRSRLCETWSSIWGICLGSNQCGRLSKVGAARQVPDAVSVSKKAPASRRTPSASRVRRRRAGSRQRREFGGRMPLGKLSEA